MRSLKVEIELKRERELLMMSRVGLASMSDAEFREYGVHSRLYFRAFLAYTSHLSDDELQQFVMLRLVDRPPRGVEEDGLFDSTCEMPSREGAGKAPSLSILPSREEPLEVL